MSGYEGFAALGDMLGGGPKRRAEGEYHKGVKESADAFSALDRARIVRAQAMARDALPDAIRSANLQHPELAASILGMATGQPNLGTLTEGYKDLGDLELDRQQSVALGEGNIELANQLGAIKKDKTYEPVRAVGGNLIPSGVALGDEAFTIKPLPQTEAKISNDKRRTDASVTRTLRPPAPRTSGGKGTSDEAVELQRAREALQAGAPRAGVIAKMKARGYGALAKKL